MALGLIRGVERHAQESKLDPFPNVPVYWDPIYLLKWSDSHPILGIGEVERSRMSGTPDLIIGLPGNHCYHLDTDVDPTWMGNCEPWSFIGVVQLNLMTSFPRTVRSLGGDDTLEWGAGTMVVYAHLFSLWSITPECLSRPR